MTLLRAVATELGKIAALPATVAAVAVANLGSIGVTLLNSLSVRGALQGGHPELVADISPVEAAFSAVPLGTVGAVILGVVAISSEYTANSSDAGGGRQITATLAAIPRRAVVLAAKAVAVVLVVAATAVVTLPTSLVLAHVVVGAPGLASGSAGEMVVRSAGASLYWALSALVALAITVLTRSGIVPLIVLITNSSLVSVSLLLSELTPAARYLPDAAGMRLFARETFLAVDDALDPLVGGLVMGAWALALLAVSTVVFVRRDA